MQGWNHFQHMADIGVHGYGPTLEAAFERAALAMTAVITDPAGVRTTTPCEIECSAPDRELLLVDWLNALIYAMATRHMLFSRFAVAIDGDRLHARVWGETIDRERHRPTVEIKGATYTELSVAQDSEGIWHARCVVDV